MSSLKYLDIEPVSDKSNMNGDVEDNCITICEPLV